MASSKTYKYETGTNWTYKTILGDDNKTVVDRRLSFWSKIKNSKNKYEDVSYDTTVEKYEIDADTRRFFFYCTNGKRYACSYCDYAYVDAKYGFRGTIGTDDILNHRDLVDKTMANTIARLKGGRVPCV